MALTKIGAGLFKDTLKSSVSGALGDNATTIRNLTSAGITGSFSPASASISTRLTTAESELSNTLISSSVLSSPAQGTIRLATNGVNTDVDSGLQVGDSPTFAAGTITGNLSVGGILTAQEIHTEFTSASIMFSSGSTKFGDTIDDTHEVTGSMTMSGSVTVNDGNLTVTDDLSVDGTTNLDNTDIDGTLTVDGGNIVFNEDSADQDFRVESNGNANMLFVDGGQNAVGIGTNNAGASGEKLLIIGNDNQNFLVVSSSNDDNFLSIGTFENDQAVIGFGNKATTPTNLNFYAANRPPIGGSNLVMSLSGSGHVIVPQGPLEVGQHGVAGGQIVSDGDLAIHAGYNDSSTGNGDIIFKRFGESATAVELVRVTSTGRLGVGNVSSPAEPLHVSGSDNGIRIQARSGTRGTLSFVNSSGTVEGKIMSNGNGDLRIGGGSSANDDIIIDNDGLVSFFGNIELNGSGTRQIRFDDGTDSEGAIVFDELTDGFIFKVGGTPSVSKTDAFKINNKGNAGIKVTPEDWDTANAFSVLQLGLGGCVAGYGVSVPHLIMSSNVYFDDTNNRWQRIVQNEATLYHQNDDGKHIWFTAGSDNADTEISWGTARMQINNDGNVGIGTDSLNDAKLTIDGAQSNDVVLKIIQGVAKDALFVDMNANDNAISVTSDATTARGISIAMNSLTTGQIANFQSNSTSNSVRTLVNIHNDSNQATGTTLLTATQDANADSFQLNSIRSDLSSIIMTLTATNRAPTQNFASFRCTTGASGGDIIHNLRGDGVTQNSSGTFESADYAEYFESKDGKAIPVGTTVKFDGDKIVACKDGDNPFGVVRPQGASLVGNSAWASWDSKYLKDDYGAYVLEEYTITEWVDENGDDKDCATDMIPENTSFPNGKNVLSKEEDGTPLMRRKLNPDWDESKTYVPREKRDEWNIVGLLGQVQITKGQPVASNWIKMKDISDTVELWFVK